VLRILYAGKVKQKASCSSSKSRVSEHLPETDWGEHSMEAETSVSHARGSQGVKAWHNLMSVGGRGPRHPPPTGDRKVLGNAQTLCVREPCSHYEYVTCEDIFQAAYLMLLVR
jgi:hypothetical protein